MLRFLATAEDRKSLKRCDVERPHSSIAVVVLWVRGWEAVWGLTNSIDLHVSDLGLDVRLTRRIWKDLAFCTHLLPFLRRAEGIGMKSRLRTGR